MIPKTIHYCWFGGKDLPSLEQRCIASWKKILPTYHIKLWDEKSFPIEDYPFAAEAYKLKKYAFVADVARLHALVNEGGIYLDTDIEILKSIDDLLDNHLVMGFETDNVIQTGVICAERQNTLLYMMLDYYKQKKGFDPQTDGITPNSTLFARLFNNFGIPLENRMCKTKDILLLPSEYLCPIDQGTWEIKTTDNSYCIHYLSGSWLGNKDRLSRKIKGILGKIFGYDFVKVLRTYLRKIHN